MDEENNCTQVADRPFPQQRIFLSFSKTETSPCAAYSINSHKLTMVS
jgi:hypothetical protein